MNPVIEKVVQPLVNRSLSLATASLKNSRSAAKTGAELISSSTETVSKVSDNALKLNKISHKTLAKLVNEQANMVEGTLEAAATRLNIAAQADSVQELWAEQIELLPKTRARLSDDMKKMFGIVTETGEELSDLVAAALADFRRDGEKATKTVAKKARKKTAKVTKKARKKAATVKKTAKKKTTAARKTAKKKTTRRR